MNKILATVLGGIILSSVVSASAHDKYYWKVEGNTLRSAQGKYGNGKADDFVFAFKNSSYAANYKICNEGPGPAAVTGSVETFVIPPNQCATRSLWHLKMRPNSDIRARGYVIKQ